MKDNKMKKYKAPKIEHWQVINLGLFVYDIFVVNAAFFLALMLRFDFRYSEIPTYYLEPYMKFAPIYTVLCIGVFWVMKLYKSIWRFASYSELIRVEQRKKNINRAEAESVLRLSRALGCEMEDILEP